jgi:hypothetical protein
MTGSLPRQNPFRVQRIDALAYRFGDISREEVLARLEELHFRGALIGDKGYGKSTLLRALGAHFEAYGWEVKFLRLHSSQRDFSALQWRELSSISGRDFILIDGAEQLNAFRWRRFVRYTRRAGGLVVTSHCAGLLPTLHECTTSPSLLRELVEELIRDADGHSSRDFFRFCQEIDTGVLLARHKGNVRAALRELYDAAQSGGDFNSVTEAELRAL